MKYLMNQIESDIFGNVFLDIVEPDDLIDFNIFETNYLDEYNPYYVSVKIPCENLSLINFFERNGFNFVEFNIREQSNLRKLYDVSHFNKTYLFKLVQDQNELSSVQDIAYSTFLDDRFHNDPMINKEISSKRFAHFVQKSFESTDERLYCLKNINSNEILAFKSHKIVNETEALMLLGGVKNEYKSTAIPVISGYFELNELKNQGIKFITTHISGRNYGVLNLELREFKFKVIKSFVILRKIYN